jgi:two-component system sensor histidine kinase KdpD
LATIFAPVADEDAKEVEFGEQADADEQGGENQCDGVIHGDAPGAVSGECVANVAMIYLAAVVVAAMWLGRAPAVVAAIAGVAAFDFFFVPPHLTFAVSDVQYLLTFAVMLTVGLLIAHLTTHQRALADASRERERRTAAMYALSRELAAAEDLPQAAIIGARHLHDTLQCDAVICIPDETDATKLNVVSAAGPSAWFDDRERGIARWAVDHAQPSGLGTLKLPSAAGRHIPIAGSRGRIGVVSLRPRPDTAGNAAAGTSFLLDSAGLFLVEALTNQIASAFERVTFIERHHAARIEAERERLRSALLSSVSHDLRTPLATITGAASTLEQTATTLDPAARAGLLRSIVEESSRLSDIISNLVFATRLEAGGVAVKREWTTIEEIIGAGLSRHRDALARRQFSVSIAPELPMVRVDNAMLPQVVHNLIENALRYSEPSAAMSIRAFVSDENLLVKVVDEGPGLAENEASRVFQRFYRGRAARDRTSAAPATQNGMGLGLTICEGIIRVHGGRIWAEPNTPRGVAFIFSLPIEHPQPVLPEEFRASESGTPSGQSQTATDGGVAS